MPSLKDLKNRIASVKNTRKITKAMQMVAAAKLRRAQEAAEAARPYAARMEAVVNGLASSVAGSGSAPRLLAGTGPRLRLVKTDSAQLYFGALYMFEHEEARNEFEAPEAYTEHLMLDDHRLSTYLSAGFRFTSYLTLNHVTYFQPNLSNFSDFRISSETSLSIKLTDRLSLRTYFQLIYDTEPLIPVPNAMYVLNNGFSLAL